MLSSLGKLTVLHATAAAESNAQQKFGSCAKQHRDRLLWVGGSYEDGTYDAFMSGQRSSKRWCRFFSLSNQYA